MKYLLYLLVGLTAFSPAYAAVTAPNPIQQTNVHFVEPIQRKTFWQRFKEKVAHKWHALKEKLRTMADDLIRLLIIALIVILIVSILAWLLPWPFDVLIVVVALIVLLIYLLRYI